VDEVEGEAANIWCFETGDLKPLIKCCISIGTGNPGKKAFEDSLIKFLSQTMVQIATETENTERKFIARWVKRFEKKSGITALMSSTGYKRLGLMSIRRKAR
jgi:hypothetical protein